MKIAKMVLAIVISIDLLVAEGTSILNIHTQVYIREAPEEAAQVI